MGRAILVLQDEGPAQENGHRNVRLAVKYEGSFDVTSDAHQQMHLILKHLDAQGHRMEDLMQTTYEAPAKDAENAEAPPAPESLIEVTSRMPRMSPEEIQSN